jgi:hypothetical protein
MRSDIDVGAASLAVLWPRVHQVVTVSEEERERIAGRLRVPIELISVEADGRWSTLEPGNDEGVITPGGPPEWEWSEQPRRVASLAARKLLGRHADPVRARLVRLVASVERGRS